MGSVMCGRPDHDRTVAQSGDRHDNRVAFLDRADASRRSGVDQVARLKLIETRDIGYRLRNVPDQFSKVSVLLNLAVHRQRNPTPSKMSDFGCRVYEAERGGLLDILPSIPRAPFVARLKLQIPSGHVEASGI